MFCPQHSQSTLKLTIYFWILWKSSQTQPVWIIQVTGYRTHSWLPKWAALLMEWLSVGELAGGRWGLKSTEQSRSRIYCYIYLGGYHWSSIYGKILSEAQPRTILWIYHKGQGNANVKKIVSRQSRGQSFFTLAMPRPAWYILTWILKPMRSS